MNTQETIKLYTERGWVFKQISWPTSWRTGSQIEIAWHYKSPRMYFDAIINDGFDEDLLLKEESEYHVRSIYGASIFNALGVEMNKLIQELAVILRLQDRGKVVPMPEEIMIKNIVVPIKAK